MSLDVHKISARMASSMKIVNVNPNISLWDVEKGYDRRFKKRGYPIHVFSDGFGSSLGTFMWILEEDLEFICHGAVQGFKVMLHPPGQDLSMTRSLRIPLLQDVIVKVKPKLITTSNGLLTFSPTLSSER